MYYYLYKIINKVNGKIYIGVHKTDDPDDDYMGSGKLLNEAVGKYGIENFEKEILKWFDSEEEMFEEEAEIVNEDFIERKDTYNIRLGGNGGWNVASKRREEIYGEDWAKIIGYKGAKAIKEIYGEDWAKIIGRKASEVIKEKYPEGTFKGKKHNEESKKKIGKANSEHQKGSGNSQYGTCWIYNEELQQNKKIKKEELDYWLNQGWQKGRKMRF